MRTSSDSALLTAESVDQNNPTPRYIQLAARMRTLILEGAWKAGEALPSERAIVAHTKLSRVTIRAALELLVEEGLLDQRHGSGTYVNDSVERIEQSLAVLTGFSEDMTSLGHKPSVRWIDRAVRLPTATESMMLGLTPGERILKLHRTRIADGCPLAVELAVIPARLIPSVDDLSESLYDTLHRIGQLPHKALQRMRACKLPAFEAQHLECEEGEPAMYIERVSRLETGKTVEYTRSYYRGDLYDFVVELSVPSRPRRA